MRKQLVPKHYVVHLIGLYCQEVEASPEDVILGAALELQSFLERDMITFDEQLQVYGYLARFAPPGFGLRAGMALPQGAHGELGYAMMACSTVRDALEMMRRFSLTQGPLLESRLLEAEGKAIIRAEEVVALGAARVMAIEELVAVWHSAQLPTSRVVSAAEELRLDYEAPAHRHLYEALLSTPVRFGCSHVEAVLPGAVLSETLPSANTGIRLMFEERLEVIEKERGSSGDIVQRVRSVLARRPPRWGTRRDVAQQLGISDRTLARSLQQSGTSFRREAKRHMAQTAEYFLESTDLPIEDVAMLMGYEDVSNFYRAARTWWGGMTPLDIRRRGRTVG